MNLQLIRGIHEMKYVVITGVSSGIGYAATKELLIRGFHVFGSVRKKQDADRLKFDMGENFTPLIFDITEHKGIEKAARIVEKHIQTENLTGLVNNAGIAISGPLMHIPINDVRYQLEVNFLGTLKVIQTFLPVLGADYNRTGKPGRIVNISSVSGRYAYPFVGPYAASKHALEAISDSLRRELLIYGIDVIVIEPGNVNTPIWDKMSDISIYKKTDYYKILEHVTSMVMRTRNKTLPDSVIARLIGKVLTTKKPKLRYLVVNKKFKNWILPRILPDRWVDRVIAAKLTEKI